MSSSAHVLRVFLYGSLTLGAAHAWGADYPSKPLRMFTSAPGGAPDFVARLLAQGLAGGLGQPVVVENRGSGVAPGQAVATAAPDGYTLLLAAGTLWTGALMSPAPYEVARDFLPVICVSNSSNVLVANPAFAANSVRELIALAKAKPGELNYGSAGVGGSAHLSAELFKYMTGTNITHVPYKGAALAVNDVLSGAIQISFPSTAAGAALVRSGKLKALGVTSGAPSAILPDAPTIASAGVPGYESVTMYGVLAPAKTPADIINRLNQEALRLLGRPDVKEQFLKLGMDVVGGSPQQFGDAIRREVDTMSKLIKAAGIKVE